MREAGPDGIAAVYLKHWLTKEEYADLDQTTRNHCIAHGGEFTLKPEPAREASAKNRFGNLGPDVIGIYGTTNDNLELQIFGFCGAMPTVFGPLVNLAMYLVS
jgi:hypothetical protein